ncbi:hypothetical protein DB347_02045 [Opitutaceae bacterium EW11]|nr:hypothetical protein DB347_02045 [Opitutaceae bacterium EW11]
MPPDVVYLVPAVSSVVYVAAALSMKRSASFGVGVWRSTFVANLTVGAVFAPLWVLGGHGREWFWLWQPALGGALFLLGQIATFVALEHGDVSVTTPVLGLKIMMVAFFTVLLLSVPVPLPLWFAAGLSTIGILLLNRKDHARPASRRLLPLAAAVAAAASFACCDVLIQKWVPAWGVGRFLPLMFGSVAVLSVALIPRFSAPLTAVPRGAWPWLLGGSTAFAVQAAALAYAIGAFGQATGVNIVYSSRGLWSVLAVWKIGHWFGNEEQAMSAPVLRSRISGAVLMLLAIALVLL